MEQVPIDVIVHRDRRVPQHGLDFLRGPAFAKNDYNPTPVRFTIMMNVNANIAHKEVSELICFCQIVLDPKRWLDEETSDLAFRIPHLDEIPSQAVRPLSTLVEVGATDAASVSRKLSIELDMAKEHLDQLCEFGFAEQDGADFQATQAGEQAFVEIGQRMIEREMFELKRRLEQVQRVRERLA